MSVLPDERRPVDGDWPSEERSGLIEVPVQLRSPGESSSGGAFIATIRSLLVGDRVIVSLTIPGYTGPVEALAEVHWSRQFQEIDDRPVGVGLRFIGMPLRAGILVTDPPWSGP
jgi:hypothetical protein